MFIQNREKGRVPCRGQLGLGAGKLKHRGFDDATRYLLFPDNLLLSRVRFVERNDLDQGARRIAALDVDGPTNSGEL